MKPQLDTIHHIAIQVSNISDSVNWYISRYQCDVSYQDESWALLQFENTTLALVLPEQHPYHFAILTDNLAAYGSGTAHRDGTRSVYLRDIDNNQVEMLQLADEES